MNGHSHTLTHSYTHPQPQVQNLLDCSLVRPVATVHEYLEQRQALAILEDKYLPLATSQILIEGKSRAYIQDSIRKKNKAITFIKVRERESVCIIVCVSVCGKVVEYK
jgi:hypothetical protein